MGMMMSCKRLAGGVMLALLLAGAVQAQERTASDALKTEGMMSSATQSLQTDKTKTDLLNTKLDQAVVCSRKNMVYAPGAADGDSQGCVYAKLDPATTNTLNNITLCALKGAVYSQTSNSCVYPGKPRWFLESTAGGPVGGTAACGGADGNPGRVCTVAGKRCFKHYSNTVQIPRTCHSRGGDSSDYCTGGGSYTTHTYENYACE